MNSKWWFDCKIDSELIRYDHRGKTSAIYRSEESCKYKIEIGGIWDCTNQWRHGQCNLSCWQDFHDDAKQQS